MEGFKIYGSPITPTFYNWAFMCDRGEQIKRYWDMIPENTDILISHGPPFGILDLNGTEHCGCEELAKRIPQLKNLNMAIWGHIHSGRGIVDTTEGLLMMNASVLDNNYKLVHQPYLIDTGETPWTIISY